MWFTLFQPDASVDSDLIVPAVWEARGVEQISNQRNMFILFLISLNNYWETYQTAVQKCHWTKNINDGVKRESHRVTKVIRMPLAKMSGEIFKQWSHKQTDNAILITIAKNIANNEKSTTAYIDLRWEKYSDLVL